jgi:hypothetical protein
MERPTRIELVINLKTAKAMDFTLPSNFLALAKEVVEGRAAYFGHAAPSVVALARPVRGCYQMHSGLKACAYLGKIEAIEEWGCHLEKISMTRCSGVIAASAHGRSWHIAAESCALVWSGTGES